MRLIDIERAGQRQLDIALDAFGSIWSEVEPWVSAILPWVGIGLIIYIPSWAIVELANVVISKVFNG